MTQARELASFASGDFPAGTIVKTKTSTYTGYSSGNNSTPQDVSGYTISFQPEYSSSHLLHIVTVGLLFDCDGNVKIRRGTYYSNSIGDTFRGQTYAFANDATPVTMQWIDTTHNTQSQIDYQLTACATGCSNQWYCGTSGDFTAYWTIMEIRQ